MNVEETSQIEQRAAKHAALSEPTRLRIVDLLTVGDKSPTELQVALGMPSNLLAHHLRALEDAGMLSRHRSEADRRRSYVALADGALDGLAPGAVVRARRLVFVCTANSARSQLAALLWARASDTPSTSAGTHPAARIADGAATVARAHGLPVPQALPQALEGVLADGDLLVTVCDRAHEELGDLGGLHWSIPDPVRAGTMEAFEAAYDHIARRIGGLASRVAAA